jgi:hypothetical protein
MSGKYRLILGIALCLPFYHAEGNRSWQSDCTALQSGITNSNVDQVKAVISKFIRSLPSQDYTEENINKLVTVIEEQCDASVSLLCYDCIKTLPSQTEIRIEYAGTTSPANKTIDITYTSNNKMKFSDMHD